MLLHTDGPPLRILFVTPECAPWIKTGGLGDVSLALPRALAALGHDVKLLMPAYGELRTPPGEGRLLVRHAAAHPWPAWQVVDAGDAVREEHGFSLLLLDCPERYYRPGNPYLDEHGRDHADNAQRFALLAHAAASLSGIPQGPQGWHPQVVHGNDWPCGLLPGYLDHYARGTGLPRPASLFTVHNLAFQGLFPLELAPELAVPQAWLQPQGAEFWGQLSFMKAGLRFADLLTAVSPTYAREIQLEPLGFGLQDLLASRAGSLQGILNGIDPAVWNPATDALIARRYDLDTLDAGKAANKAALQRRMGLPEAPTSMLLGMVSRLTEQKGVDLVLDRLPLLLELGAQLVVLGSGDPALEQRLREAAAAHPLHVAVKIGFDEALAHQVEAGADAFLMPSRFEPCGLNQMYSQAYGTPPIVHATGGLADSVVDLEESPRTATGFSFGADDAEALGQALQRAHAAWLQPQTWRNLQRNGMRRDFSWQASARAYVHAYRTLT
jgi:starch synthase